jgi:hypothetical protein
VIDMSVRDITTPALFTLRQIPDTKDA